jgi:hypothetical protein
VLYENYNVARLQLPIRSRPSVHWLETIPTPEFDVSTLEKRGRAPKNIPRVELWNVEVSMEFYEIRILREDGTPAITIPEMYPNDTSAVRSGRLMARGRPVEVWRGTECIWGQELQPPRPPHRPLRPAA